MGIGMVFQHFSLFQALTVAENIQLALPAGEPLSSLSDRVRRISAEYGIGVDPDARVHNLSVGQQQRVEIMRCLLQNPSLLIMDEPTSVLTLRRQSSFLMFCGVFQILVWPFFSFLTS